ncbi:serine hydrolase domain-containing protein [Dactylosporangium sp. CS-033363]|uniref:serine hydrolase domain-containing protein n=1 Tax=Dactylosporangium sp. CS-033363 TaxID=3239935 RepID=UPI003D94AF3C
MTLQQRVQEAADELVASGAETGLQVAVHHRGSRVVDVVAGGAAPETLFFSFSAAKGVTSAIAHLLVGRGLLGYDTPVAEVWPEFGARGKETATLRHVLTHTAGVPALPGGPGPADLADWPRVCAAIAGAEPQWQPGSRTGYHSYTFGFLVGEIARRVTGQPMRRLLHEWIAEPLGIAGEVYFGVPAGDLNRLARLEDAGAVPPPQSWEWRPSAALGNDPGFLRADIPSVGTFTARGLATVYAAMLDGRLVTADRLAELSRVAFEGTDAVFGNPARLALGYPLGRIGAPAEEAPTAFGWPGGGGSYAFADPATGTSFAVTKNRLTPDFATAQRLSGLVP